MTEKYIFSSNFFPDHFSTQNEALTFARVMGIFESTPYQDAKVQVFTEETQLQNSSELMRSILAQKRDEDGIYVCDSVFDASFIGSESFFVMFPGSLRGVFNESNIMMGFKENSKISLDVEQNLKNICTEVTRIP